MPATAKKTAGSRALIGEDTLVAHGVEADPRAGGGRKPGLDEALRNRPQWTAAESAGREWSPSTGPRWGGGGSQGLLKVGGSEGKAEALADVVNGGVHAVRG